LATAVVNMCHPARFDVLIVVDGRLCLTVRSRCSCCSANCGPCSTFCFPKCSVRPPTSKVSSTRQMMRRSKQWSSSCTE